MTQNELFKKSEEMRSEILSKGMTEYELNVVLGAFNGWSVTAQNHMGDLINAVRNILDYDNSGKELLIKKLKRDYSFMELYYYAQVFWANDEDDLAEELERYFSTEYVGYQQNPISKPQVTEYHLFFRATDGDVEIQPKGREYFEYLDEAQEAAIEHARDLGVDIENFYVHCVL